MPSTPAGGGAKHSGKLGDLEQVGDPVGKEGNLRDGIRGVVRPRFSGFKPCARSGRARAASRGADC